MRIMIRGKLLLNVVGRGRIAIVLLLLAAVSGMVGQRAVEVSLAKAAPWFVIAIVLGALGSAIHGSRERPFRYPAREQLETKTMILFVLAGFLALGSFYSSANAIWGRQTPAGLWVASIALGLIALWGKVKRGNVSEVSDSSGSHVARLPWEWIVVTFIFVGAFLLRFVELERFPLAVHNDEANCGLMAQQILAEWRAGNVDWFRIRDFYLFNTLGFVPSAIFQGFFPPSLFGHRLANVVWSMGALALFYLLTRDLFGKVGGIAALALAATAHFSIHWSRTGIHCGHAAFLASMAMWFLWKGISTGKYKWFALLGVTLTFCFLTYGAAQAIPVAVAIVVGTYWVFVPDFRRTYTLPLLTSAGMMVITSAPLIDVYMRKPEAIASRSSAMVWTTDQSSIRHMKSVHGENYRNQVLKENALKSILLFNKTADRNSQYGFRRGGILDTYSAAVFLAGLGVMLPRLFMFSYWPFILFMSLTMSLGSMFTMDPAQYGRLAGLAFVMGLPTALWIRELYYAARDGAGKYGGIAAILFSCVCLVVVAVENFRLYFSEYDLARGDNQEASVHLIADEVASRGLTNKTFVFKGSFPTDFTFQPHRFIAAKLSVEPFTLVQDIVFPEDPNIRSLAVIVPLSKPEMIDALARKFPSGAKETRRLSYRESPDFYWVFVVPERVEPIS